MTPDEAYAKCKTLKGLKRTFLIDRNHAETREEIQKCEEAYAKHYKRLFEQEMETK